MSTASPDLGADDLLRAAAACRAALVPSLEVDWSVRAALSDRTRLDPDWSWHPAPLAEWDGTIKQRKAPPAWR